MKTRHVVISGGASGLGLGMALRYLKRGDCVTVLDLKLGDPSRKQLEIASAVGSAQWCFYETDVTRVQTLEDNIKQARKLFGDINLAINSAGIPLCKTIADLEPRASRPKAMAPGNFIAMSLTPGIIALTKHIEL